VHRRSGATRSLPALGQARHGVGSAVVDGAAYVLLGGAEPGLHVTGTVERPALAEVATAPAGHTPD
jgi:hypothetical protein